MIYYAENIQPDEYEGLEDSFLDKSSQVFWETTDFVEVLREDIEASVETFTFYHHATDEVIGFAGYNQQHCIWTHLLREKLLGKPNLLNAVCVVLKEIIQDYNIKGAHGFVLDRDYKSQRFISIFDPKYIPQGDIEFQGNKYLYYTLE